MVLEAAGCLTPASVQAQHYAMKILIVLGVVFVVVRFFSMLGKFLSGATTEYPPGTVADDDRRRL